MHSPLQPAELAAVKNKRAIPQPTKDFWTVHLVGTFEDIGWGKYAYGWTPIADNPPQQPSNTVFIYMKAMEDAIDYAITINKIAPNDKQQLLAILKQFTIAHEIGHIMNSGESNLVGIMYEWAVANFEFNNLKNPDMVKFHDEHIKIFQASVKPR